MTDTTIISPYRLKLADDVLTFTDEQNNETVMEITEITPSQEEMIILECSSKNDFFNLSLAPRIKEEVGFNDLEVEIVRTFLQEVGYFD